MPPLPSESGRYIPNEAFNEGREGDDVLHAQDVAEEHANKGYQKVTQKALHRFKDEEEKLLDQIDNPQKYKDEEEESQILSMSAAVGQSGVNAFFRAPKRTESGPESPHITKPVDTTSVRTSRGKGSGSARKAKYHPREKQY